MYDAMERARIQTLKEAGVGTGRVSALTGASKRTVRRVAAEPRVGDPGAVDEAGTARVGRPSKVAPFVGDLQRWLKEEPGIAGVTLLMRAREEGYAGGKSAFYTALRGLRAPNPKDIVARFEGIAGEFSQHDFGQVWVRYQDGSREHLHFFVSCLKFSRKRRMLIVPDETTETVCHSLVDAFEYLGGIPLLSVFDNPRTIVTRRDGDQVVWQETFSQFCCEIGVTPTATWPRRPARSAPLRRLRRLRLAPRAGLHPSIHSPVAPTSLFPSPASSRRSGESVINTHFLPSVGQNYVEGHTT